MEGKEKEENCFYQQSDRLTVRLAAPTFVAAFKWRRLVVFDQTSGLNLGSQEGEEEEEEVGGGLEQRLASLQSFGLNSLASRLLRHLCELEKVARRSRGK